MVIPFVYREAPHIPERRQFLGDVFVPSDAVFWFAEKDSFPLSIRCEFK
jgi:hypothetical protein